MNRIRADSLEVAQKSALRNLKSAILSGAMLLALSVPAEAQQTRSVPMIAFLTTGSAAGSTSNIEAFRQGLRELGYVEGKNINIEYKYADGRSERLPKLAEELVRLKVDILIVSSSTAARPARKVTATIPIVLAAGGNLDGLVTNLARPGGNVTGLYQYSRSCLESGSN